MFVGCLSRELVLSYLLTSTLLAAILSPLSSRRLLEFFAIFGYIDTSSFGFEMFASMSSVHFTSSALHAPKNQLQAIHALQRRRLPMILGPNYTDTPDLPEG